MSRTLRRLATMVVSAALILAPAPSEAARPDADAARPLRVMPLGDSITFGVGSPSYDGYRTALRRWLAADGVQVDYVGSMRSGTGPDRDNEGHKGWTVAQLAEQVDGWLAIYRPDVILLHIGTNDMVRRVPDAAGQLDRLLDRIAADAPQAEVFVARIVGIADDREVGSRVRRTAAYNDAVTEIVASKGVRFHLVDQSDVRGADMWNREHPNDFGYHKMAWNWYRAMRPAGREAADDPYRVREAVRCSAKLGCHTDQLNRYSSAPTATTAAPATTDGQGSANASSRHPASPARGTNRTRRNAAALAIA
ncbi:lysophospholipase L1-like esterase [Actinoplanes tereljensis]